MKVRNKLDERDYAVKKIRLSRRNDSNLNKKILREVSTLSRVSHENVVRYYQAWIEDAPLEEDKRTDDESGYSSENSSLRPQSPEEEDEDEEDEEEELMNEDALFSSTGDEGDKHLNDSLEDLVSAPVFEGEDVNCDPAIFSNHFDLPKGKSFRMGWNSARHGRPSKKKKKKRRHEQSSKDESFYCWCHLCSEGYRDWEVSFVDWKDKPVGLQPINLCQNCYCQQLQLVGVDTSLLSMALKPELKRAQYLYIQMEYCHFSLREILNNKSLWERAEGELWKLFRQIVEGLAHIHSKGIIHRDLKPDNVFVTIDANNEMKTKIGDFGLATSIEDTSTKHGGRRGGGEMTGKVGTFLYSSPEMVSLSRSGYDEKVDIYALGIILFELWRPFDTGMERCKLLEALRNHLVFPPDFEQDPKRDDQRRIIRWMLQKDPKQRPSAQELLKVLSRMEKGNLWASKDDDRENDRFITQPSRPNPSLPLLQSTKREAKPGQSGTVDVRIQALESCCLAQQAEIESLRHRLAELQARIDASPSLPPLSPVSSM